MSSKTFHERLDDAGRTAARRFALERVPPRHTSAITADGTVSSEPRCSASLRWAMTRRSPALVGNERAAIERQPFHRALTAANSVSVDDGHARIASRDSTIRMQWRRRRSRARPRLCGRSASGHHHARPSRPRAIRWGRPCSRSSGSRRFGAQPRGSALGRSFGGSSHGIYPTSGRIDVKVPTMSRLVCPNQNPGALGVLAVNPLQPLTW